MTGEALGAPTRPEEAGGLPGGGDTPAEQNATKAYSLQKTECMFLEVVTIHAGGAKVDWARQPLVALSALGIAIYHLPQGSSVFSEL